MPQSLAKLPIHLVFSTKNRTPWLAKPVRDDLHAYIGGILNQIGCGAIQTGGVEDHVHILFHLSRTMALAQVVEKIKTATSKHLKSAIPDFAWQAGYGAFAIGRSELDAAVAYVRSQEDHHGQTTFQDEFRRLLEEFGIEFDERYVWD